jgi:signal peptidase I
MSATEDSATHGGAALPPSDASDETTVLPGASTTKPAGPKKGSFFRELPFLIVLAFLLALLIKATLIQAFYIPSGSMEQTLLVRDRVLVNKLVYDFRDIHRGEVVVFDGEGSFTQPEFQVAQPSNGLQKVLREITGAIGLGAPAEKDFIKRVIGLPGDRVSCCSNGHVTVQPAGSDRAVELIEPYVFEDNEQVFCEAGKDEQSCPPGAPGVLVPEGRIFVLGDHRGASSDSREYLSNGDNGTVPIDEVIGRAFVVVWPLGRADLLSVPETFDGGLAAAGVSAGLTATPYALGVLGALPVTLLRRRRRARPAARGERAS